MDASDLLSKVEKKKPAQKKKEKRNGYKDKSFDNVMASISQNWKESHEKSHDEKLATKREQTSNKVVARKQSVINASLERDKSVINASLKRDKSVTGAPPKKSPTKKSVTKASLVRGPEREQMCEQSVTKASLEREQKIDITEVSTQGVNMLQYLFQICSSIGERTTPQIKNSTLIEHLETTSGGLRSLILRLKKQGFLIIKKTKNGPSGWRAYQLPESTYKALADLRNTERALLKREQSVTSASPNASLGASLTPSSSNSSNITNTITTRKDDDSWLQEIQIPSNLKSLGFGVNHLKQLKNKFSLSPNEIQSGLEAFSFDLEKGEGERLKARGIQNLIGFFFGAMKSGGYNPVNEGFETAEEAAEKEMLERLKKRKEEKEDRKKELEDLLFQEWIETKEKSELAELSSPPVSFMDTFHKAALKNYFRENEMDNFKRDFQ